MRNVQHSPLRGQNPVACCGLLLGLRRRRLHGRIATNILLKHLSYSAETVSLGAFEICKISKIFINCHPQVYHLSFFYSTISYDIGNETRQTQDLPNRRTDCSTEEDSRLLSSYIQPLYRLFGVCIRKRSILSRLLWKGRIRLSDYGDEESS